MATATKNKFLPLKQQLHFYYTESLQLWIYC